MKKVTTGVLAGTLAAAVAAGLSQAPATAAIRQDAPSQADRAPANRPDVRPGPLTARQNKLRAAAVKALIDGTATKSAKAGGGSVVKLGKDKAVEFFDNNKQARVLSILADFGDTTVGKYGGTAGPVHNAIPQPDRTQDNSTTWEPDFGKSYYETLFNGSGESMKSYYQQVSGGRYTVDNTVQGWTKVPYNGAYYGANPREDEGGSWDFINDTGDSWYAGKLAELGSKAAVDQYLAQFDQWDRYDFDGDGNFNEADGYIDHFQAIHAGEGEEAGASPDAIWSHRWYVNATSFGSTGPTVGGTANLLGGAQIGDSKYFIGDYTVEPENGGLGVFVHEYGHDLGLPDFYDTAGGDNGTSFWTTMSSGSWLGHGGTDGIGTMPNSFGPDEKLFLGWLDHAVVQPGQSGTYKLSAAGLKTAARGTTQAVVVNLPDKSTTTTYTTPPEGTHAWWSGRADGLNNKLTRPVPAASSVKVTASGWYQIEAGYDYLYGEYSLDNGATWQSAGAPLDGASKGWANLSWSYRPGGQPSLFRFRYQTDGGVNEAGAFLDSIVVTADRSTVVSDGAESGDNGWTAQGWTVSTGTDTQQTDQYYLLENRQYTAYDATLKTGPYNFSEGITRPNWVEFFPYQDGLLAWFADKAYADNNTSAHPGHGQALPVDARPKPFTYPDGTKPGNRRQPFDATFGLQATDSVCLHKQVLGGTKQAPQVQTLAACAESNPGIATFDDTNPDAYWSSANPWSSTKVAGHGAKATVTAESGGVLTVNVTNPAAR
ncbi:M6 family metalloprotease domain-containing protein [Nocardioides iriomotensis]|uniref:M6 family metalloprotease domain-containing protein n=1 Tax=Nocardioides iriomotensis TaxID=715784 RepID=A0A4Q5J635_9ACTN|nr:M6 family metalloprotease domain-containing protein [Nocardioides iriomotensis]